LLDNTGLVADFM